VTLFASVALFRRDGRMTFKAPRKEASNIVTQARKSASRFWRSSIQEPDKLAKVIVVACQDRTLQIAEHSGGRRWVEYTLTVAEAALQPHLAACMVELGIDAAKAPPLLPDTLEINGIVYRREI